jgi:hypothetical protein
MGMKYSPELKGEQGIVSRAVQTQRREAHQRNPTSSITVSTDKPEDLDAVWKQFNAKPDTDSTKFSPLSNEGETIKIRHTYEFAGQVVAYVFPFSSLTI